MLTLCLIKPLNKLYKDALEIIRDIISSKSFFKIPILIWLYLYFVASFFFYFSQ